MCVYIYIYIHKTRSSKVLPLKANLKDFYLF